MWSQTLFLVFAEMWVGFDPFSLLLQVEVWHASCGPKLEYTV